MLRRTTLFLTLAVIVFLYTNEYSYSQDKWWKEKKYKNESTRAKYDLCKRTFKEIGNGFLYENANLISQYFDSQVYLNVIGTDKGYYSPGQAELILIDFMDYFTLESFRYLKAIRYNTYAFVNGVYTYSKGSGKRDLKVSISLKYYDNKWYVDQISIN